MDEEIVGVCLGEMKIVIFGIGLYYQNRKETICSNSDAEIIAYIDNNAMLWGQVIDSICVFSPKEVKKLEFDYILLMSANADIMKNQLLDLHIPENKILFYEQFCQLCHQGKMEVHFGKVRNIGKKKALLFVHILGYTGVPTIAIYTAKVLINQGYQVTIAANEANRNLINDLKMEGFVIITYGNLANAKIEELFWIFEYDLLIVNSLFLIGLACEIAKQKRVMFYLHEPDRLYDNVMERYRDITEEHFHNVCVYAVSDIAKKGFERYFPNIEMNILPFGIPDTRREEETTSKGKVVMAIIGYVTENKAQDIFVNAVLGLTDEQKRSAEFWIIGSLASNGFGEKIIAMSKQEPSIKLFGEMDRAQIEAAYQKINIVVCASKEETGPLVITEGMMHGKICVTTDSTGMAKYIDHGKNGFVIPSQDAHNLTTTMGYLIENKDRLIEINKNARATYEAFFSMETYEKNLANEVKKYMGNDII